MTKRIDDEWASAERLAAEPATTTEKYPTSRVMVALAVLLQRYLAQAMKSSPLEPHERFSNLSTLLSVVANDIASRSERTREL